VRGERCSGFAGAAALWRTSGSGRAAAVTADSGHRGCIGSGHTVREGAAVLGAEAS
jgi:hypothetical protein